jgi:hypothetical protein
MNIIELILDENDEMNGIEAISVVSDPAIESDFIALANQEIKLATVDTEKRILMGAALIPNKHIYRRNKDKEFYIFFSSDTVNKASQLYLKKSRQGNATLEHDMKLKDMAVVESWIVSNPEMDKSKHYGLSVPKNTWMVSMKVDNDEIWNDYVKTGKVKGFSIEGYFADKVQMKSEDSELIEQIKNIINGKEKNSK